MNSPISRSFCVFLLALGFVVSGCGDGDANDGNKDQAKDSAKSKDQGEKDVAKAGDKDKSKDAKNGGDDNVISLFDGKTLGKWKPTKFGGEGEVEVKDGKMILHYGEVMTGVTWQGESPATMNYEITLEAMRMDGSDFFMGLTVPVGEKPISWIVGGWGGGVVGLSSLDGFDASENETTSYMEFENGKWYKFRLRVEPKRIQAWIDGKDVIDVEIDGRKIHIRPEVELSKPLGFASFQTTAALRNIKLKKLEATPAKKE